jgi:hypothetical protein
LVEAEPDAEPDAGPDAGPDAEPEAPLEAAPTPEKTTPRPAKVKAVTPKTVPTPVETTPAPVEAVEAVAVTGTLMLNSLPWSNITIDGQNKGPTDWKGDLASGKHNVVLTTSDGRVNRTVLDVKQGEIVRWCWDFDKGAACSR